MEENVRRVQRCVYRPASCGLHAQEDNIIWNDTAYLLFWFFRFYENLQSALLSQNSQKLQVPDPPISEDLQVPPHRLQMGNGQRNNPALVYQRRRKREKNHLDGCCSSDGSGSIPELEDCLHLFTWWCEFADGYARSISSTVLTAEMDTRFWCSWRMRMMDIFNLSLGCWTCYCCVIVTEVNMLLL